MGRKRYALSPVPTPDHLRSELFPIRAQAHGPLSRRPSDRRLPNLRRRLLARLALDRERQGRTIPNHIRGGRTPDAAVAQVA